MVNVRRRSIILATVDIHNLNRLLCIWLQFVTTQTVMITMQVLTVICMSCSLIILSSTDIIVLFCFKPLAASLQYRHTKGNSSDVELTSIVQNTANADRSWSGYYKISFNCSFCWPVKLVGNLILTPTMKSPRSAGFLLFGMPRLGYRSVHVGPVGPPLPTLSCLPSMVCTVRRQPVRASLRSSSIVRLMSSPSRVKRV
jgi:hypothetical protein